MANITIRHHNFKLRLSMTLPKDHALLFQSILGSVYNLFCCRMRILLSEIFAFHGSSYLQRYKHHIDRVLVRILWVYSEAFDFDKSNVGYTPFFADPRGISLYFHNPCKSELKVCT